jgi:LysR family transcriptional regulator, glycine cleavage system transcriptional activator
MLPNLPFMALRAFEAVVRLRGFGRAAEELGVTQSSVSQHVKQVEEWIGRSLLVRGPKHSVPTDEGRALATAVAEGVGQVADMCAKLRDKGRADTTITVSCPPGFAVNWLFPRLMKFDQLHSDIPVSISTDPAPFGFVAGKADVAILYGMGNYPELHVEKLLDEQVFPVCAPSLLRDGPPLGSVADLARHTFLLDELADIGGNPPTWAFWAEQTGQILPHPARIRRFGQANMVVQAAVQGLGVALGRKPLVADALTSGALVTPLDGVAVSQFAYWFVCPKGALNATRLRQFRDWLFNEATVGNRIGVNVPNA